MTDCRHSRCRIIGIGNPNRGDDGIGRFVAQNLRRHSRDNLEVIEHDGEATSLMDAWRGIDTVILIDAVQSGAPPGTIHRYDANRKPLPTAFSSHSSHAFSVSQAIELARALDQLPRRLIVFGIEGKSFEHGSILSPPVTEAGLKLADQLASDWDRMAR